MEKNISYNKLTPDEERIIIHKGTEPPFTGKYNDHFESGIYLCRRCDNPLYKSEDKFKSHCGWPSFDDEIPGAIKKETDRDGMRTEILCNNCGGHLGHVFTGERLTDKNIRHCVNSVSMKFIKTQQAIFAGGCFWGIEYHFNKQDGVIYTEVGYSGGDTKNPTYEEVCRGNTGHAEAIKIYFDANKVTYKELAKLFFEIHDPTQVNRQGPDVGEQYRSAIFYFNEEQRKIAENLINQLEEKGLNVATIVDKAGKFYRAEEYHQNYYDKKRSNPYCHIYTKRF
jgi:peptide methionine sulfoxide reductase msrA/msrB